MFADEAASFAAGALYLLRQPLALAMLVALVLVARDVSPRHAAIAFASTALGASASVAIAPAAWQPVFVSASLAAISLIAAGGITWRPALLPPACGVCGVALGVAGGLPTAHRWEAYGALLACGLLVVGLWTLWQWLRTRHIPVTIRSVGPRVIASWLAAVGLLMIALELSDG